MSDLDIKTILVGVLTLSFLMINRGNYKDWKNQPYFMKHFLIYLAIAAAILIPLALVAIVRVLA